VELSRDRPVPGIALEREPTSMKRNAKLRLILNRETLRNLNAQDMKAAAGGFTELNCTVRNTEGSCFQSVCGACITHQTCPTNCGQTIC
jgi:hypothetical protein